KQISRLLEMGGTMLAQHCTTCGAPMFRYQGEVLCPLCQGSNMNSGLQQNAEQQVALARNEIKEFPPTGGIASSPEAPVRQPVVSSEELSRDDIPEGQISAAVPIEGLNSVAESLKLKIGYIAGLLQVETDPRRMDEYLDIMDKCLDILERLK
ncbi:hypothetical protein HNV12_28390, partial [Methanococcoides sp. SA1]|nr:hypothetical protein [Methanococcoides sp. SA1]